MEWKQPEGLKRRWVIGDDHIEMAFGGWRFAGARGRIGDSKYELQASGYVKRRLALVEDGKTVATMEPNFSGTSAKVKLAGEEFTWKVTNIMATKWALVDREKNVLFSVRRKGALRIQGSLEVKDESVEHLDQLILLCWFAQVLHEEKPVAKY